MSLEKELSNIFLVFPIVQLHKYELFIPSFTIS